jgi:hypothetical protein
MAKLPNAEREEESAENFKWVWGRRHFLHATSQTVKVENLIPSLFGNIKIWFNRFNYPLFLPLLNCRVSASAQTFFCSCAVHLCFDVAATDE